MYTIIVARYNENIDWLTSELSNCIIYNKGMPLQLNNEIKVDNKGRESETYLQYIISHYDKLPDVVVFTQAKISDHIGKNDVNYLLYMKDVALQNGKMHPFTHYQTASNKHCWDKSWNYTNGFYLQNNYKHTPVVFHEWFTRHINATYPNPIHIYRNGLFAVKKEIILKNSLEYYKKLIEEVNHHSNPAEGHFFERSWYYIFN